jgi:hypothetical protein
MSCGALELYLTGIKEMVNLKTLVLLSGLVAVTACAACQQLPIPTRVEPTMVPMVIVPTPTSAMEPTATPVPTITAVSEAAAEVNCQDACHFPDPDATFAAGAMAQPPTHTGRTTCLSCHSTLSTPALPTTHMGRLDPSCALCHVEGAAAK